MPESRGTATLWRGEDINLPSTRSSRSGPGGR
jgi:hypothetical protein